MGRIPVLLLVPVLLLASCLAGCGATSASPTPPVPSGESAVPIPLLQTGVTQEAREYLGLANALNAAMASIPAPERSVEELTASYGMQAAIMAAFADGFARIDWPAGVKPDAAKLLALARATEFYDAALGRAPSMAVIESLEARRDAATAGWQSACDAISADLQLPPITPPTTSP